MGILAALTLTLQLADARQSVHLGAREMNPIVRPLTGHPAALYAVKLGTGAVVVAGARSLRKAGHTRGAFWYLVAVNAAQGAVVLRNWRVGR